MNKKLITNMVLGSIIALNITGCSLQKKSPQPYIKANNNISMQTKTNYQERMKTFIEKLEQLNPGIDMTNFYENVKTLIIRTDSLKEAVYGSYDIETNTITLSGNENSSLEHELMHVVFANRKTMKTGLIDENFNGKALEEGIVETFSSETNNSENTYKFNVAIAKIFTKILGKDIIVDAINKKELNIITKALATIKPNEKDAFEFVQYFDYEHKLLSKLHEDYFTNGNINNFKSTQDYEKLKSVRSDLVKRIKIYIKAYYNNKINNNDITPGLDIPDMIGLLNLINNELFDKDIEITQSNDFFLKNEFDIIMKTHKVTNQEYDSYVVKANNIKYLVNNENTKTK